MKNELTKLQQSNNPTSTGRLVDILETTTDAVQIRLELADYFNHFLALNKPKFEVLLKTPSSGRLVNLPALVGAKNCLRFVNYPVMECIRAAVIQNNDLAIDISMQILAEAGEDNLSLQDIFIFAKGFVSGRYGKIYGQLTLLSFMEKFEEYRQERHEFIIRHREEEQANHRAAGTRERSSDGQVNAQDEIMRAVYNHYSHIKNKE